LFDWCLWVLLSNRFCFLLYSWFFFHGRLWSQGTFILQFLRWPGSSLSSLSWGLWQRTLFFWTNTLTFWSLLYFFSRWHF
jgi:hypothetical protein